MTVSDIAKTCHEANRALCAGLGDNSQMPWEEAEAWQRDSAINGVLFNLANPDAPASASHDSWLEEKRAAGWKFGTVKDAEKKEHPCFVPYEALPVEQQAKDHLFKAIVAALAPLVAANNTAELPLYQCHKKVRAAKIEIMLPLDSGGGPHTVSQRQSFGHS
ncbi:MAG: hypothetical protein FD174_2590 [Geobacteraceae bacterium]|nr:MAG: hypothetical protein FD174_2590 [Geobacteraceae bacterium]